MYSNFLNIHSVTLDMVHIVGSLYKIIHEMLHKHSPCFHKARETNGIYVPQIIRKKIFESMQGLSYPGIRIATQLLSSKFIWPELKNNAAMSCRGYIPCQKTNVHLHTKIHSMRFHEIFAHIYLDIIGSLCLIR